MRRGRRRADEREPGGGWRIVENRGGSVGGRYWGRQLVATSDSDSDSDSESDSEHFQSDKKNTDILFCLPLLIKRTSN